VPAESTPHNRNPHITEPLLHEPPHIEYARRTSSSAISLSNKINFTASESQAKKMGTFWNLRRELNFDVQTPPDTDKGRDIRQEVLLLDRSRVDLV